MVTDPNPLYSPPFSVVRHSTTGSKLSAQQIHHTQVKLCMLCSIIKQRTLSIQVMALMLQCQVESWTHHDQILFLQWLNIGCPSMNYLALPSFKTGDWPTVEAITVKYLKLTTTIQMRHVPTSTLNSINIKLKQTLIFRWDLLVIAACHLTPSRNSQICIPQI